QPLSRIQRSGRLGFRHCPNTRCGRRAARQLRPGAPSDEGGSHGGSAVRIGRIGSLNHWFIEPLKAISRSFFKWINDPMTQSHNHSMNRCSRKRRLCVKLRETTAEAVEQRFDGELQWKLCLKNLPPPRPLDRAFSSLTTRTTSWKLSPSSSGRKVSRSRRPTRLRPWSRHSK